MTVERLQEEAGNSVATRARGLQHPKGSRQHQNGRKVNVHVKASGLDASSPPINHSNHNSHHAADMSPPARFPPSDISPSAQAPPSERHIAAVSKGVSLGDHASIEARAPPSERHISAMSKGFPPSDHASVKELLDFPPAARIAALQLSKADLTTLLSVLPPTLHIAAVTAKVNPAGTLSNVGSFQKDREAAMHLAHALALPLGGKNISALRSLLVLDLSDTGLGDVSMRALAPATHAHASSLQVLRLANNPIGSGGAAHLAPYLGMLSNLKSLNLSNTRLTPAAIWVLAPDIARCPVLSQLTLSHNPIGKANLASWEELKAAIGPPPDPSAPPFSYPEPSAYAEHARDVAYHMKRLSGSLRHLDLSHCGLCPISGRALSFQLPALTRIQSLNLSGNAMDFGRAKPSLSSLTNLRSLRLAVPRSDGTSGKFRVPAQGTASPGWWAFLAHLKSLVALDLSGLDMRSFGRLQQHLATLTGLRVLTLGGGERAYSARALADTLLHLTSLEVLSLNNSHLLEPAGEDRLTRAIYKLPRLLALSLSWGLFADEAGLLLTLNNTALCRILALNIAHTAMPWDPALAPAYAKRLRRLKKLKVVNLPPEWCDVGAIAAMHAAEPALKNVAVSRVLASTYLDLVVSAASSSKAILELLGVDPADIPQFP